jgi:CBS domain-containing protein
VVREEKPIGMVTDRDIAVALTTRNCLASEIQVGQLTGRRIVVCRAKDKVKDALKKMAKFRIRRLPVVDKKGNLVGIVTFADILRVSEGDKKLRRLAVRTLGSILKPQASVGEDKKEK